MSESTEKPSAPAETLARADYEAPRVERLLTQADLDQEVLFAGKPAVLSPTEW